MDSSTGDRFYDRTGEPLPVDHWLQLRGNDDYTVLGDWRGEEGSAVRTVWTGFRFDHGYPEPQIFETHCLVGDEAQYWTYCTEDDARTGHEDCVRWIREKTITLDGPGQGSRPAITAPAGGFFDRHGQLISAEQWALLRADPGYCLLDRWHGEGGAYVEVHWVGFDPAGTFHVRPQLFGLTVAAFENCPLPDSTYRFLTERRALDHFNRILPLVERGIRPWDDDDVEAAGFDRLTLRAW